MSIKRRFLWLVVCMFFLLAGITAASFFISPAYMPVRTITLTSATGTTQSLDVEWAATPAEQARGLMFRSQVRSGMLFVFEQAAPRSFWMKNTLVPLDIIFFDAEGTYVSATTMQPCKENPCPHYLSEGPAQYALEMPAGFIQKSGIGQDWKIGW